MIFSSRDLLQSHLEKEHSSLPCQYCTEEFGNVDDLAVHGNFEHSDNVQLNWFSCDSCSLYYPTAPDIQNHSKVCQMIKMEANEIDFEVAEIKQDDQLDFEPVSDDLHPDQENEEDLG